MSVFRQHLAMLGYNFMRPLPDIYQQVEYLQGTGTQVIRLNLKTRDIYTKLKMKMAADASTSSWARALTGDSAHTGGNPFTVRIEGSSYIKLWYGVTNPDWSGNYELSIPYDTNPHEFEMSNTLLRIDDKTRVIDAKHTSNQLICLFGEEWGTYDYNPSKCRIYYVQLFRHFQRYICNLVPCYRKSDNKPGMYDLKQRIFFTNINSGTDFIVGPDVVSMGGILSRIINFVLNLFTKKGGRV